MLTLRYISFPSNSTDSWGKKSLSGGLTCRQMPPCVFISSEISNLAILALFSCFSRQVWGEKNLGPKKICCPSKGQYSVNFENEKFLIDEWMTKNFSIERQNLMTVINKSQIELSWRKNYNSFLSSFSFLVSLFFLVFINLQRRFLWICDWGSYPFFALPVE